MPSADRTVDPSQLSTGKKIVFTMILIVFSLIVLTVAGEVVLRLLEPPVPVDSGSIVRRIDDRVKQYELLPNSTGVLAGAPVSIDSFGCRDREYPRAKPQGVIRIVGIGDSLTFGQGVAEPDTYLARLENDLTARHLPVEVINCGVFGYNVNEEARRFQEVMDTLDPDIVTIGYELGDVLENPPLNTNARALAREDNRTGSMLERRHLIDSVKSSRVVTFLAYRYTFLLKKFNLRNWDSLYADDSALWKNLAAKYTRMEETAKGKNVDLLVAIVPELSNLDDRYPFRTVHERVAALCQSLGIHTVDLLPAFKGQNGPSLWVHPQDRHPNAQGHQIIAAALVEPVTALVKARLHHANE